jgi:hypothetical protein
MPAIIHFNNYYKLHHIPQIPVKTPLQVMFLLVEISDTRKTNISSKNQRPAKTRILPENDPSTRNRYKAHKHNVQ